MAATWKTEPPPPEDDRRVCVLCKGRVVLWPDGSAEEHWCCDKPDCPLWGKPLPMDDSLICETIMPEAQKQRHDHYQGLVLSVTYICPCTGERVEAPVYATEEWGGNAKAGDVMLGLSYEASGQCPACIKVGIDRTHGLTFQ